MCKEFVKENCEVFDRAGCYKDFLRRIARYQIELGAVRS